MKRWQKCICCSSFALIFKTWTEQKAAAASLGASIQWRPMMVSVIRTFHDSLGFRSSVLLIISRERPPKQHKKKKKRYENNSGSAAKNRTCLCTLWRRLPCRSPPPTSSQQHFLEVNVCPWMHITCRWRQRRRQRQELLVINYSPTFSQPVLLDLPNVTVWMLMLRFSRSLTTVATPEPRLNLCTTRPLRKPSAKKSSPLLPGGDSSSRVVWWRVEETKIRRQTRKHTNTGPASKILVLNYIHSLHLASILCVLVSQNN